MCDDPGCDREHGRDVNALMTRWLDSADPRVAARICELLAVDPRGVADALMRG